MKLELDDDDVDRIATAVVMKLQTGTPGYVDQHRSALGPRRFIAEIRKGRLPGRQVGRLWLAKQEDHDAFIAALPESKKPAPRTAEEELAAELGITLEH